MKLFLSGKNNKMELLMWLIEKMRVKKEGNIYTAATFLANNQAQLSWIISSTFHKHHPFKILISLLIINHHINVSNLSKNPLKFTIENLKIYTLHETNTFTQQTGSQLFSKHYISQQNSRVTFSCFKPLTGSQSFSQNSKTTLKRCIND